MISQARLRKLIEDAFVTLNGKGATANLIEPQRNGSLPSIRLDQQYIHHPYDHPWPGMETRNYSDATQIDFWLSAKDGQLVYNNSAGSSLINLLLPGLQAVAKKAGIKVRYFNASED